MNPGQEWLAEINPHPRIVGKSTGQKTYIDPKRVIYDHELMLFGSGGAFVLEFEDGRRYEFGSNSFVIIPPGQLHVCRGVISEHVERAWVHFDWSYDNRPVAKLDMTYAPAAPNPELYHLPPAWVPDELIYGEIQKPAEIFTLHHRMQERFNFSSGARQQAARALLLELLIHLLSEENESDVARPLDRRRSPFNPFSIRDALAEYALLPFNDCPPMKQFLQDRGQSYDHQSRIFKKSFGVSPLQYVNSLRIEAAANLLRDTNMRVGDVAEQLGYDDLVYFGRCFKKYMGMNAQAYRQQVNPSITI